MPDTPFDGLSLIAGPLTDEAAACSRLAFMGSAYGVGARHEMNTRPNSKRLTSAPGNSARTCCRNS